VQLSRKDFYLAWSPQLLKPHVGSDGVDIGVPNHELGETRPAQATVTILQPEC
jgi:hypothetical protein